MRPAASLVATTALALALGACKIDNRPLLARGGPPPAAVAGTPPLGPLDPGYAPIASQPAAYPQPAQAYAYPERAYAMSQAVERLPPSYAFGYGEEQPWVWDAADQGTMFAEPIDDGYRYYYYEPGAAYPYFVQDPDYGYAYGADGALVALFAATTGALIAADHYRDYGPRAELYWTRGYDLDRAYRRSPRYAVRETVWRERAPALVSSRDRWFRAARAQPGWREAAAARAYGPRGDFSHDNGRQFGPDRGDARRGREVAFNAPQAQRLQPNARADHGPPQARAEQGPRPNAHAARGGQQEHRPQPAARQIARQEPRPQQHDRPHAQGGQPHNRAFAGGQQQRHGPAMARAAEPHGRDAAFHGDGQPQTRAQHGPGGGGQHGGGERRTQGGGGGGGHAQGGGGGGHGGGGHADGQGGHGRGR